MCIIGLDIHRAFADAVLEEVTEWQNRPLDLCYPLVFFDPQPEDSFRSLLSPNRPDLPRSSPNRSGCSAMAFAIPLPSACSSIIAARSRPATSAGLPKTCPATDCTL